MKLNPFKLSRTNTTPFVLVSLFYTAILLGPFIYFTVLKSSPHTSYYVKYGDEGREVVPSNDTDSTEILVGKAPANNFDDEDVAQISEGEDGNTVVSLNALTDNWKSNSESRQFRMLARIAIFSFICAMGALGAAVSLITRTKNKEFIENEFSLSEIISVQTIGAIFAMILGFAFLGNMISGTLFPNPKVFYRILYIPPAFGKLAVWSFIAGFSERLVPNILYNLTQKNEITKGQEKENN
jgi:hypothetical protein